MVNTTCFYCLFLFWFVLTNLTECLIHGLTSIYKGIQTDVIYLDYLKCFDRVGNRKLMLVKLSVVSKELLKTGSNAFFVDRKQYVQIRCRIVT